jgi:hypothetical protein
MTFSGPIRLRDDARRRDQEARTSGYRDGLNGRPAARRETVYQQAWRRGREARQATQDGAA